jgi:hypothetical protein
MVAMTVAPKISNSLGSTIKYKALRVDWATPCPPEAKRLSLGSVCRLELKPKR